MEKLGARGTPSIPQRTLKGRSETTGGPNDSWLSFLCRHMSRKNVKGCECLIHNEGQDQFLVLSLAGLSQPSFSVQHFLERPGATPEKAPAALHVYPHAAQEALTSGHPMIP